MRCRWIVAVCVGLVALCIAPQAAETNQDDGEVTMKQRVKPHIERAVEFLRSSQNSNGTWAWKTNDPNTPETIGATALCAVALMENNVPVNDEAVKKAYSIVSKGAGNYNYSTCLCVMYLDRYNRTRTTTNKDGVAINPDARTILTLAHRIAAGQMPDGGWGYTYPGSRSDNSNTQFAVVALWLARKYEPAVGGPIHKALKAAEKKFRDSQRPGGCWAYDQQGTPMQPSASMTLAGILGLALGAGSERRSQEARFKGQGAGGMDNTGDPYQKLEIDPQVALARKFVADNLPTLTNPQHNPEHSTYMLWSLERVCKLYRWKKIEGLDWFAMGANWLIAKQRRNGSWAVDDLMSNPNVDTAFSLLFLGQSNLLGDLYTVEFTGKDQVTGVVIPTKRKPVEVKKVDPAVHSAELAAKLIDAPPGKQRDDILSEFEETRGAPYTTALAGAIEKIPNPQAKEAAREVLRKRLQRLSKKSLGEYMIPDEVNTAEIRLAAAAAVKYKNDPELAELVIPMLKDDDAQVRTQARETLISLAGVDLGDSVERWSKWLEESKKVGTKKEE
jgi:hypothetical protein